MENMRGKVVALLLMMVFVSAHGDCYDDCMKGCTKFPATCDVDCRLHCSRDSNAEMLPSSAPSHVFHRGGPELKEGEE